MSIVRNSAKCISCGEEVESTHRHDFVPHRCPNGPEHWVFAVDGGKDYIRRVGSGYEDTSIYKE